MFSSIVPSHSSSLFVLAFCSGRWGVTDSVDEAFPDLVPTHRVHSTKFFILLLFHFPIRVFARPFGPFVVSLSKYVSLLGIFDLLFFLLSCTQRESPSSDLKNAFDFMVT